MAVAIALVPPVTDRGDPDRTFVPSIVRLFIVVCETVTPPVKANPDVLLVAVAPAVFVMPSAMASPFSEESLLLEVIVMFAPEPDTP